MRRLWLGLILIFVLPFRPSAGSAAQTHAYVFTTDFSTGSLSVVDLATRAVTRDVASVHSDARLRWYNGRLYVVNRLGQDNIQVIDPAHGYATVLQFSTGSGSNPSDIAFVSPTKAYVARFGLPSVMVVNPMTGESVRTPISLAQFADADGNPEMDRMILVGPWLFVALERLSNFVPTDTSLVAVIDTRADSVLDVDPVTPGKQAIVLSRTNPVTSFALDREHGQLLLGCAGHYQVLDGGIEILDLATLRSLGPAITETELGGDIGGLAWNGPDHSYAIVIDASFNSCLVSWTTHPPGKIAPLMCPGGFSLADCALDDRHELYVCDNKFTAPGLFAFSTPNDQQVAGPLDTGLPPYQITFDEVSNQVASVPIEPGELALSAPRPNPAQGETRFRLIVPRAALGRIEAFDLAGRRVRSIKSGELTAGINELQWNLRDDVGNRVGAGVYLVRAMIGTSSTCRRVVVLH